jgi:sec-independent protein translocase protein TatB
MSVAHLIVLLVIALIVLGPEKLPQVARTVGKAMAEFRRITGDFRSTIEGEMRDLEREVALKELRDRFPEKAHYDHQLQEEAIETAVNATSPATPTSESAPGSAEPEAAETEGATASGKPTSNGEPTPA